MTLQFLVRKTPSFQKHFQYYIDNEHISIERIETLYNTIRQYKQLFPSLFDQIFETFEKLDDYVNLKIKENDKRKFAKQFISNKYAHLLTQETIDLFDYIRNGLNVSTHKEFSELVMKKVAIYKTAKNFIVFLNKTIANLDLDWNVTNYTKKIKESGGSIVFSDTNTIIVHTKTYPVLKILGSPNWCIVREKYYFDSYLKYTSIDKANQYIIFDFTKKTSDNSSMIGLTYSNGGISACHNYSDHSLSQNARNIILTKYEKYFKSPNVEKQIEKVKTNLLSIPSASKINDFINLGKHLNFDTTYILNEIDESFFTSNNTRRLVEYLGSTAIIPRLHKHLIPLFQKRAKCVTNIYHNCYDKPEFANLNQFIDKDFKNIKVGQLYDLMKHYNCGYTHFNVIRKLIFYSLNELALKVLNFDIYNNQINQVNIQSLADNMSGIFMKNKELFYTLNKKYRIEYTKDSDSLIKLLIPKKTEKISHDGTYYIYSIEHQNEIVKKDIDFILNLNIDVNNTFHLLLESNENSNDKFIPEYNRELYNKLIKHPSFKLDYKFVLNLVKHHAVSFALNLLEQNNMFDNVEIKKVFKLIETYIYDTKFFDLTSNYTYFEKYGEVIEFKRNFKSTQSINSYLREYEYYNYNRYNYSYNYDTILDRYVKDSQKEEKKFTKRDANKLIKMIDFTLANKSGKFNGGYTHLYYTVKIYNDNYTFLNNFIKKHNIKYAVRTKGSFKKDSTLF